MISLLGTFAFSEEFKMSDPDFKILYDALKVKSENRNYLFLISFIPSLKYFFLNQFKVILKTIDDHLSYATGVYKEHLATFKDGIIRDFTDAMISAKKDTEVEDSNDSRYLNDQNIVNSVLDLFGAGSETTKSILL